MKQTSSFWRIMLMSIITVVCVCISACGSDDPELPTPPTPTPDPKENGEVTFDIKLPEGNGSGTSASPAIVQKGETLDMTISQKSSYTDPDGTVFTCEPKAEIVLFAKLDTVVAKDLANLTKVKEGSDVKSSSDGTSPVCQKAVQTFEIGGQSIVFDLSHEIYTYVNSMKDKIEMPYIKLNQATLGNHKATEETPQGRSTAVSLTGVTVRPLNVSRATTITDSTLYEVNAQFNLDIESVNAKQDTKQTLVFSVTYIGVVETTTELQDPESVVSFTWDVKSGTNSTVSPFVKTIGNPLEIWMSQSSRYTDEYGNIATGEPKAKIKFSVAQDTIWVANHELLSKIVDKTGNIGEAQAVTQVFGSDNQDITIDWSYEVASAELGGKEIEMPYYTLKEVSLTDVSVEKIGYKLYQNKEADLYKVTVTFHQKAIPENITGTAVPEEIEYVVSYVGAEEIKLTKVEYIPSGEWNDPHDNLHLAYYAMVTRRRTYSNGAVQEDEFTDFGHFTQLIRSSATAVGRYEWEKGWYISSTYDERYTGDSIFYSGHNLQIPSLKSTEVFENYEGYVDDYVFKDWSIYRTSKLYDESVISIGADVPTDKQYPSDSRPTGWYYRSFFYEKNYRLRCNFVEDTYTAPVLSTVFNFSDQFLVIDGRRIDFSDLHNLSMQYTFNEIPYSTENRTGKIFSMELNATYLNKKFYSLVTDTIFVAK